MTFFNLQSINKTIQNALRCCAFFFSFFLCSFSSLCVCVCVFGIVDGFSTIPLTSVRLAKLSILPDIAMAGRQPTSAHTHTHNEHWCQKMQIINNRHLSYAKCTSQHLSRASRGRKREISNHKTLSFVEAERETKIFVVECAPILMTFFVDSFSIDIYAQDAKCLRLPGLWNRFETRAIGRKRTTKTKRYSPHIFSPSSYIVI